MRLTDAELEALLVSPESDRVERKGSFRGTAPKSVRQAVCAFANDLPGHGRPGVVFVGVRDDGTDAGIEVTDELLRGLATTQDERILNERRRHRDRPFDVQPVPSAAITDLDRNRFEREYLPAAVAPDVLAANDRTTEERLASLKMVTASDTPTPTVVGIFVLGKDPRAFIPGAYVQFLRLQGSSLTDPIVDEQLIDGPLLDTARALDEKLAAHNRVSVDFTSTPSEQRRPQYPPVALQQVTRNALLHRTYEGTNTPVRVSWFDDRIEVFSPGGPFGTVTVENFGEPYLTDYRNPNLAEAMRALGLVQRFGAGLAMTRAVLRQNGNPEPEFTVAATHVLVTLRCAR